MPFPSLELQCRSPQDVLLEAGEVESGLEITRSVLVTNIPFQSRGVGLVQMVKKAVAAALHYAPNEDQRFCDAFVVLDRNVHGHVSQGSVSVVFRSPREAALVIAGMRELSATADGIALLSYEGNVLRFDLGAGKVRDHCFPLYPFHVRRLFELDSEAVFSATDQVSARRTSSLLKLLHSCLCSSGQAGGLQEPAHIAVAYDLTASVGCNSLELSRCFTRVVAIEADRGRAASLQHNVLLAASTADARIGAIECVTADCVEWLEGTEHHLPPAVSRVVFCDPPWGGPAYREEPARRAAAGGTAPSLPQACNLSSLPLLSGAVTVEELLLRLCGAAEGSAPWGAVVCAKLPAVYDTTSLAEHMTRCRPPGRRINADSAERNFPFRFHFGRSVVLFVVLVAGEHECGALWYSNRGLDSVVAAVQRWHETAGEREHRPEFYDYAKKRWIVLKKWIPSRAELLTDAASKRERE